VVYAHDVLLDDRSFIEVARDEVGGGADDLYTASVRLTVGVRALESGQERMVDVDGPASEELAQLGREDLHVAGKHDELDVVLLDLVHDAGLERCLLGGVADGHPLEGDAIELGETSELVVVAEHEGNMNGQLTG